MAPGLLRCARNDDEISRCARGWRWWRRTSGSGRPRKEADIIFNYKHTSLRKVAELLTSVGYEPYISLSNLGQAKPKYNKSKIYKLGVAGFCFANIMMLSFPEYSGIDARTKSVNRISHIHSFTQHTCCVLFGKRILCKCLQKFKASFFKY